MAELEVEPELTCESGGSDLSRERLPNLAEIEAAAAVVYQAMPATPQYSWPLINQRAREQRAREAGTQAQGDASASGGEAVEVWIKHENHTPVGAFKIRGGLVYMEWLRRGRGDVKTVVSATRGNHGQSMAFAAARHGLRCVIVVPLGNSPEKNQAMRALGAELVEFGSDFQAACERAMELEREHGWHRVPSYDPLLVAGVATYGLEMLRGCPPLDRVYVPIGMGSGACGMMAARDALGLETEIVGVVSARARAFALSFARREVVEAAAETRVADGVACRRPDKTALAMGIRGLARVVEVDDDAVEDAMRLYFAATHNVAEGAGAIGLAALLEEGLPGRSGTVLCGGNVDSDQFAAILAHG